MAWIKGTWYNDDIEGTYYADRIEGFEGEDFIWGFEGNDLLFGGAGDDTLYGGSGNDDLYGGTGWDRLEGGFGHDDYYVDSAGDEVFEYAGEGSDLVRTTLNVYSLPLNVEHLVFQGAGDFDGTGNVHANRITGGSGNDVLDGLGGGDALTGGVGDDDLFGGSGHDRLSGGSGLDWLFGGTGNDVLTGGAGADDFHFDTVLNRNSNVDRIADFQVDLDAILLDRDVFTRITSDGALGANAFVEGTRALDAQDRILYDEGTGRIFYDADGSGAAASVLFAIVTPGTDLIASDFIAY